MANAKAMELFKDEKFLEQLENTKSAEEAQELFQSNGGEITIEELNTIRAMAKQQAGEKLDADELDLVAGGGQFGREVGDAVGDIIGETLSFLKKTKKIFGW